MPQIIVTINETGEAKVEAKGVSGSGCKALTKAIEQALGSVSSDQAKPEMFTQVTGKATVTA